MRVIAAFFLWLVVEIVVFVEVVHLIGAISAVLAVIVISAFGPWLVRQAGLGVWRRSRERLAVGELPGREAIDGVTLLVAGVLICVPGFVGDLLGILILLPPGRALVRVLVARWFARHLVGALHGVGNGPAGGVVEVPTHDLGSYPPDGPADLGRPGLPGPRSPR
jgi:UPF0716 protein FxsA